MALSPVLYNSEIPFVHLEEARLIENVQNEMVVRVQLSNETMADKLTNGAREFGNFIYLATDRQEIVDLASSPAKLKTMIVSTQSDPSVLDNSYLSLTKNDFTPAYNLPLQIPDMSPAPVVWAHRSVKSFVLNRIKGGSIMTGLISDAHIDKVFDGSQVEVGFAAALEASQRGEIVVPLGGNRYKIPSDLDVSAGRQTVEDKKINNLYILVASYRLYKGACFLGNVTKETLLEEGLSMNKAILWTLQDEIGKYGIPGTVWPGDIHIQNGRPMTGTFHRDIPHPSLEVKEVDNTKIKDMRFLKIARTLPFEYASPEKSPLPYFSPLSLSRDSLGQIHGMFGFDLYEYGRNNAKYGLLIQNTESLLSCLRVRDFKMSHRIIRQNLDGNDLTPGANLNADRPAGAALDQSGWVPIPTTDRNNNQTHGQINLRGVDESRTTNVVFVDPGTHKLSKGTVEYKVEMIVEDQTKEALTKLRDELQLVIKDNWTPYSLTDSRQARFEPIIEAYLSTIVFIFGSAPFEEYSIAMWRKNLESLVAPSNPSDQDRVFVIDLIRDFISKISQQLHTGQSISAGSFNIYSSIAHSRIPDELLETYTFTERYQMYRAAFLGMSYNDGYLAESTSLVPSISFEDYDLRTQNELSKYELTNPTAEGINRYGYISPTSLMLGAINNQVNQQPTTDFKLDVSGFTPLFRNNSLGAFEYDYQPEKTTATNIEEIFNAAGVQMTPLKRPLREVLFPELDPVSTPLDATLYMSTRIPFPSSETTAESALSGSEDRLLMTVAPMSTPRTQMLAAPGAQWVLNSQIALGSVATSLGGVEIPEDGLHTPIPNSIAAAKVNQDPGVIEDSNSLSNAVNFEALVRVEYLVGYGSLGAYDPQWEILNTEAVTKAQENGESLLCRLIPLANVLDSPIELGLPALDTLFILGDPTPAPTRPGPDSVLQALKSSLDSLAPTSILSTGEPYMHYSKNAIAVTQFTEETN